MADRHKGLWALYAAIVLLAATGIFAKKIPLSPIDITVYRSVAAAAVLMVVAGVLGISLRVRQPRELGILVGLGGVLVLHWATFFQAMQVSSVAIGMGEGSALNTAVAPVGGPARRPRRFVAIIA